jgi:RNA polymerase sigma factor for flagellar operon FliA
VGCGAFVRRVKTRAAIKYRGLVSEEDLEQEIQTGLSEAARTFDESKGIPFEAFAWQRVCGLLVEAAGGETRQRALVRRLAERCMTAQRDEGDPLTDTDDHARAQLGTIADRIAAAAVLGLVNESSARDALAGDEEATSTAARKQMIEALRDALQRMPEQPRAVLESYYFEERELKDVASSQSLGYSTARRVHNEALATLAAALRPLAPTS